MTVNDLIAITQELGIEREKLFNQLVKRDHFTFDTESLNTINSLIKSQQLNIVDILFSDLGNLFEVSSNYFESAEEIAILFGYINETDFQEDYTLYRDKNYTLIVKNSFYQN